MIDMLMESFVDGFMLGCCGLLLLGKPKKFRQGWTSAAFCVIFVLLLRQNSFDTIPEHDLLLPADSIIFAFFLFLAVLLLNSVWAQLQEGVIFFGTCTQFALYMMLRASCVCVFGLLDLYEPWLIRVVSLLLLTGLVFVGFMRWLREQLESGEIPLRILSVNTLLLLTVFWCFAPKISETALLVVAGMLTAFLVLLDSAVLFWEQRRIQQSRQMHLLEQYLPMVEELVESVRARQHEFNHQLMAIQSALGSADSLEEARKMVAGITSPLVLPEADRNLLRCDSKVLSGMLFGKISQAQAMDIQIELMLDASFLHRSLSEADWVELIGILMDNAMEASAAGDTIYVEASEEDHTLRFTVSNPCPPRSNTELAAMFRRGWSTKNGDGHGYGLYNVRLMVEHHHGKLLVKNSQRAGRSYLTIGALIA